MVLFEKWITPKFLFYFEHECPDDYGNFIAFYRDPLELRIFVVVVGKPKFHF